MLEVLSNRRPQTQQLPIYAVGVDGLTLLAICAIGASSAKPRLHTGLGFGPPLLAVITILVLARPDSLASYAR